MTFDRKTFAALMATTAVTSLLSAHPALAQQTAAQSKAAADAAASTALGEVVVTATRQINTVDRVALSMTASTQKTLDAQGVRDIADLARVTPGLIIRRSDNNAQQPSIRGIISAAGAPTTGIYLDDTALQKYNGTGATVGNGAGTPPLFDLDRIEVLRGPQGTLFGGASEGGTIRYITPAPNMSRMTGYVRTQISTTEGGALGYEGGIAVGGPIIQDRIGFRASVFSQHIGGYLDHIDQYTGQQTLQDSNYSDRQSVRLVAQFNLTPDLKVTPGVFGSVDKANDVVSSWLKEPTGYTVPTRCWDANGKEVTIGAATSHYCFPGYTYGPYNFYGPGKAGGGRNSPATARIFTPNVVVDYDFHLFTAKSITTYMEDEQQGYKNDFPSNDITGLQNGVKELYAYPDDYFRSNYSNQRHQISEELRFNSAPGEGRLTWVAGLYYNHSNLSSYGHYTDDLEKLSQTLRGVSATVVFGVPDLPGNVVTIRNQFIVQDELAGFGQGTFAITKKLKVTAGVRVSKEYLFYDYLNIGPVAGINVPTYANGALTTGSLTETPVTPKFGIEYQLTDRDLLYVNAAQGFRQGGVNTSTPVNCAAALAALGTGPTPTTFKSDSVWSYEAGAKLRLLDNRVQFNTAVFRTDWSQIQSSVSLPTVPGVICAYTYTVNAAKAISQGVDMQANFRLFEGLTGNVAATYTDAHYVGDLRAPALPGKVGGLLINNGDPLPTPPWSVVIGMQYDRNLWGKYNGYLRGDYQYTSQFKDATGFGPGTSSYVPDAINGSQMRTASLRAGVSFTGFDISVFANNITDSQDMLGSITQGGRSGCSTAACTTFSRYNPVFTANFLRPREIGVALAYRY